MRSSLFAAAALLSVVSGHKALAGYSVFTPIVDPNGVDGTTANGINNAGEVVGTFTDAGGTANAFTYLSGVYTTVNVTGAQQSFGQGISGSGAVTGFYEDSAGAYHGVSGGVLPIDSTVAGAAAGLTFLSGVSQNGTSTAGYYLDTSAVSHGLVNGAALNVPGATATVVTGVNNGGTAVGYFVDGSGATHGFSWHSGSGFTTIDAPAATNGTWVTGVNDQGQLSGYFVDSLGTHGFVQTGSVFLQVDAPGSNDFTEVTGINDSGAISGVDVSAATGLQQGFEAVPEPATLSVLGFGLSTLVMARRRRSRA